MSELTPFAAKLQALALSARAGDELALDELLRIGTGWIRGRIHAHGWYLPGGGDEHDMVQEGLVGLWRAVYQWDPAKASFVGYAAMAIWRDIEQLMRFAGRQKHRPLNQALSLNLMAFEGGDEMLGERRILEDESGLGRNPADIVAERLTRSDLAPVIGRLSEMERRVLGVVLDFGRSKYGRHLQPMGVARKQADNARERAKRKLVRWARTSAAPPGLAARILRAAQ